MSPLTKIQHHRLEAIHSWHFALKKRCIDHVEQGLFVSRTSGMHVLDPFLLFEGLFGTLSTGDLHKGAVFLKHLEALFSEHRLIPAAGYYYFLAWEAWLQKNQLKAKECSQKALALSVEAGSLLIKALCQHGLVKVLLKQKAYSDIEKHLKEIFLYGKKAGSKIFLFFALLIETQLRRAQGQEKKMIVSLKAALRIGREQGYVNEPWWDVSAMAQLCVIALTNDIEVEYVRDLIRKRDLFPDPRPLECENWPWPIKIFTLGQVKILKEDKPISSTRKTPQKAMELLYALITHGESGGSEDQLVEALWPSSEGDKAYWALKGTLARLRQWLGNKEAIQLQGGRFYLSARHCWVDAWAADRLLGEIEAAVGQMPSGQSKQRIAQIAKRLFNLYRGPFLGQGAPSWAFHYQKRLHSKYCRQIKTLGSYWERAMEFAQAETCYQKGLELDPTAELFTQRLMALYKKLGRRTEAMAVYRDCEQTLSVRGEEPHGETRMLYRKLQG